MISIETDKAPRPAGPYSQATVAGNIVFVSGQIPVDPANGNMPETIEEQTKTVLSNLKEILKASKVKDDNIVSVTVYLSNIEDFHIVNSIYEGFFKKPYPARSCIGVAALPKGSKIMVDAVGLVE
jgi:endoribonuclease L-PSP, putative